MNKVSVIIPAYNEADRILNVLKVLSNVDYLDDIIVVDDGSTDGTTQLVNSYREQDSRMVVITNPKNKGKGQAVFSGLQQSKSSTILMLDADLRGLTTSHIDELCHPVLQGKLDMTIGVFKHGQWASDFSHWLTPWLSGQRCLRAKLFSLLTPEAASGYGLETALTIASHQYHWRVARIAMNGVSHPPSEVHRGSFKGVLNRAKMYLQIIRAWYLATAKKVVKTGFSQK